MTAKEASEEVQNLSPRLQKASDRVRELRELLKASVELRDELVVEAIDLGVSQREVARLVGVQQSRIVAIISQSQPEVSNRP